MLLNSDAHKATYNLLYLLDDIKSKTKKIFQIVISKSLTSGLIFSTLVDITYGGAYKYGCFASSKQTATSKQNAQEIDKVLIEKINKTKGRNYFDLQGLGLQGPKHFINNIILNERTLQDYTIKCDDNDLCQSNRTNTNSASIAELNSETFKLPDAL